MKFRRLWVVALFIAALILPASFAWADLITLEIDGIEGPDMDPEGNPCIILHGLGFNITNPNDAHIGGGGGAGRADFQPIQVLKKLDETSPRLFLRTANGAQISEVTIKVWKGLDAEDRVYFRIDLISVLIVGMSTTAGQGQDTVLELVSFSFRQIQLTATPLDPHGGPGGDVSFGWDLEGNVAR